MKLNLSYLINTALTVTLLTVPALSTSAKEVSNYNQDHSNESHTKVIVAPAKDAHKEDQVAKSADQDFVSKHTIEMEFTFAILIMIVGLGYFYKSSNHV